MKKSLNFIILAILIPIICLAGEGGWIESGSAKSLFKTTPFVKECKTEIVNFCKSIISKNSVTTAQVKACLITAPKTNFSSKCKSSLK